MPPVIGRIERRCARSNANRARLRGQRDLWRSQYRSPAPYLLVGHWAAIWRIAAAPCAESRAILQAIDSILRRPCVASITSCSRGSYVTSSISTTNARVG